jgi:hypothetical protein
MNDAMLDAKGGVMQLGCEWIPVDQRLPAEAVRVLATDGTDVFDSEYCMGNWEWCADVTHWTELPEPPEVRRDGH